MSSIVALRFICGEGSRIYTSSLDICSELGIHVCVPDIATRISNASYMLIMERQ